jgi:phage terminase large subunit-like protein
MLTEAEERELAAREDLESRLPTFHEFVARYAPQFAVVPPHLQPLFDLIERTRHERVFATVSQPPRSGKTTTFALAIAWRVLCDPVCLNFYGTFGDDLASTFGRVTRKLVTETVGVPLDTSSHAMDDWRTLHGGGLKSTSVGGPITGRGCNGGIIILDDTIKSWEVALSDKEREKVWNWIIADVRSRLEGGSSLIVCGTRWHEDDPIGRILAGAFGEAWRDMFTHINLPAIHDGNGAQVDERIYPKLAQPLWLDVDSEHPGDRDAAMRWYALCRSGSEHAWWSLYQGRPLSLGAKLFIEEPARFPMPLEWLGKRGAIILDPSATAKQTADWGALGAFAIDGYGEESRLYVAEVLKMRLSQPDQARMARSWQQRYKLLLGVEAIGGFAGIPQMLRELEPDIRLVEIKPGKDGRGWVAGDKRMRSIPVSKAWNASRVLVPMGTLKDGTAAPNTAWIDDYVRVMQRFTGADGMEDDVVDISAHAWNLLYKAVPKQSNYRAPPF